MFKNLLTTEKDLKEAAVIEKRQRDEDERKKRFFDSKQRIIGVSSWTHPLQISPDIFL